MTLLIVDDEELTRSGVISIIDWEKLGITEILQAKDGLQGLETARKKRPEIIMSDIRMPRMDGITMLKHLEKELPDTSVIFMSGYSEKQYLKAAIQLKAVNYIEKPLQPSEILEAVQDAIRLHQSKIRSHRGQQLQFLVSRSDLARMLTAPPDEKTISIIHETASSLTLELDEKTWFTSIIVHTAHAIEITTPMQEAIYSGLQAFISNFHMTCLYTVRKVQYLIYEIVSKEPLMGSLLQAVLSYLQSQYTGKESFYITAGESAQGLEKAFLSYTSAVSLMQSSFFYPAGSVLTVSEAAPDSMPPAPPDSLFEQALTSKDRKSAESFLERLQSHYEKSRLSLPNMARDRYYRLFMLIENAVIQNQIPANTEDETILSSMENCFSYQELHSHLVKKTEDFFISAEESDAEPENSTIKNIVNYISENYMQEGLSVKDISSHVFLSASYVCTVFKNETGKTLSQYITEFRMEKAKQLLSDPRYRISDISSNVGYSDGNYFGKSFKKYTGMTPSEFRERMIS